MSKTEVLFLCPLRGNGGIVSWAKKYIDHCGDEISLHPVDISPDKDFTKFTKLDRIYYGVKAFFKIRRETKKALNQYGNTRILHIASAGGLGVFRDYWVATFCKRRNITSILHCHFGCIKELYERTDLIGSLFRKLIAKYDQIWVLDNKSQSFLNSFPNNQGKVFLTPNPVDVPASCDLSPKKYTKIGFVGNLIPSKGIFDLVLAVKEIEYTELYIVGEGKEEDKQHIKEIAENKIDSFVHFLGRLPNKKAIEIIDQIDILALPTYYQAEAFPISILEAMSRGKLVISCSRAAIPDMLTSVDGSKCGLLVPPKSPKDIKKAITWCQTHTKEADEM